MIQTTRYQLNTPCRIALLTDMHNQPWEDALRALEQDKPDIICIAGDLLKDDYHSSFEEETNILPFLRACVSLSPTFFSFGNHEWCMTPEQIETIRELDITILDNEWIRREGILIGGLTPGTVTKCHSNPDWRSDPAPPDPVLDWLSEFESQDGYKVLLCHHPEYYPKYLADRSIDLVLSGHAHGGQWRFFGRGLFAPGQGLFPKFISGVHAGKFGSMLVSRGLSNPTWIPRINNPCEVVIIE